MSMKKPLSVDEWGIRNSGESFAARDNPVYIPQHVTTSSTPTGPIPYKRRRDEFGDRVRELLQQGVHMLGTSLTPKPPLPTAELWNN
jgi:hypothetical protein